MAAMESDLGQLLDQKLEQRHSVMKTELGQLLDQKLEQSLGPLTEAIVKLTNEVSKCVTKAQVEEMINTRCNDLEEVNKELHKENRELKDRLIYLESQSRRNNLKILGLQEPRSAETWQDCENSVQTVLSALGVSDTTIERAHRLGPQSQPDARSGSRPVVCKFLSFKDRERVLNAYRTKEAATKLPPGVKIFEDFPQEVEAKRRELMPFFHAARHVRAKAKMSLDRLIINGTTYTVDNKEHIPPEYHPRHTSEVSDTITAFYTKQSPLSNFYPCQFSEAGTVYSSVEQYITHKKATLFSDSGTAEGILKTDDPYKAKALGKKVKGFNAKLWNQEREHIMLQGLKLKFDQNPRLKAELAATKKKMLVEASPVDRFWGAGLNIHHPSLSDPSAWPGKNVLGKLLMEVRASLCG